MANFANQQLTDLGWDAISEQNVGRRLLFNRVVAGDGELPPDVDPDDLSGMTELVNYVMDMNIGGMTADGHGRATIYASILSRDVTTGFFLREIGVIGIVDEGLPTEEAPILYSICNALDQTTYIPAADEVSKVILGVEIHIIVGKELQIDVTVTAGTIQAINLGDPQFPAVLAAQTGLIQEFRRLRSPNNSIELTQGVDYVDITSNLIAPGPGEPGGPDSPDPQPPDSLELGLMPVGVILPYCGINPPAGYFWCRGQEVSQTDFARLFAIIGTAFNIGNPPVDPVNNFRLPFTQRRVLIGFDGVAVVGTLGGAETTFAEIHMPSHNHGVTLPPHGHGFSDPGHIHGINDQGHTHNYNHPAAQGVTWSVAPPVTWTNGIGTTFSSGTGIGIAGATVFGATYDAIGVIYVYVHAQGGNAAHINMQPFIVVNYIIKF